MWGLVLGRPGKIPGPLPRPESNDSQKLDEFDRGTL